VARQWWKYAVASSHVDDQNGWNESSRRYITENEEFYIPEPDQWRSKPANSKQGSGEPIEDLTGGYLTTQMEEAVFHGIKMYNYALDQNVAPEIARLFLPAYAMYVRWRWTVSLQGVITFLDQRLPNDAQFEIREYAGAVAQIVEQEFPYTWKAWKK
jgi:thymidylate synthase (FAD)